MYFSWDLIYIYLIFIHSSNRISWCVERLKSMDFEVGQSCVQILTNFPRCYIPVNYADDLLREFQFSYLWSGNNTTLL